MNKIKFMPVLAVSGIITLLSGCITTQEIVVGKDENGNEIVHEVGDIDKNKAAMSRIRLANSYILHKQMTDAKKNLEIANNYDPDLEELGLSWGYYYSTVGDLTMAENTYKKVLKDHPDSGTALTSYGIFLCNQKRYTDAESYFLEAVKKPKYTNIGFTYGRAATCASESGDKSKARVYFEKAMDYGGSNPELLFNYATFCLENGDSAKAEKLMKTFDMFVDIETPQVLWLKLRIAYAQQRYADVEVLGRRLTKKFKDSDEADKYVHAKY